MKEMARYGITLSLICVVASASLAVTNSVTGKRIAAQLKLEEEAGLKEVFPEADSFEPVKQEDELLYYKAISKDKKIIGAAFKVTKKGYSSPIEAIVGMAKDGTIKAVKILSQNETPGLGSRVSEPSFLSQFTNKDTADLNQVQAITGATISSKAVIDAVTEKAQIIKDLIIDAPKKR
ncbi:MAG: RnfABCDGE type electron transport complex subunit G [Candidatus Omnitrophota bacterium]